MRGRPKRAMPPKSTAKLAGALQAPGGTSPTPGPQMAPPGPPQSLPAPLPQQPAPGQPPPIAGMKKGGNVPKTGNYKLHQGETVVPANSSPRGLNPGATDGLGSGRGGLAIHSSAKGANIAGYEPIHSSKQR